MDEFDRIVRYVERETEFATSHYDDAYLKRRITARTRRTRSEDFGSYFELLESDAEERAALLDAFSINVTSFFRNPKVWEGIRDLLRTLTAEKRRVTLWSAACSDGREPYSMALLALSDPDIDASKLRITGTDIDAAILEVARSGVYRSTQTTDIADQLRPLGDYGEYVSEDDGRFEVEDAVKSLVRFEHHDLIRGEPKTDLDLVVCRNLFIYIDAEYKLPMLETVRDSLRDDGYLVIGKTETLPESLKSDFEPVDRRLRIYRRV